MVVELVADCFRGWGQFNKQYLGYMFKDQIMNRQQNSYWTEYRSVSISGSGCVVSKTAVKDREETPDWVVLSQRSF